MIRLVISNQRGGVGKTTTTIALAREFADRGKKVLIIDTDGQGSISTLLDLKPTSYISNMISSERVGIGDCAVQAHENITVICSNRDTNKAETMLLGNIGRERTFIEIFRPVEKVYDVVLIDSSPSINLLQTCAMVYAQQVLIPVSMDTLSLQGAIASLQAANTLGRFMDINIRPIGMLPTDVNQRMAITTTALAGLDNIAKETGVPVLPLIRTDQVVKKAARNRQFLADYDPKCKALEDYRSVVDALLKLPINDDGASAK